MYKNYEEKIYEGVYEANELYGIEALTTKIISKTCGVSEGSFYRHFENKDELLQKAYVNIDREIAKLFSDVKFPKVKASFLIPRKVILKVVREKMWDPYFDYFIKNPRKGLFYIRYVELYGDNQDQFVANGSENRKEYYQEMFNQIGEIDQAKELSGNGESTHIVWTAIIDTTLTFAKKIILGKIPDTKETRDAIFNIIFTGCVPLLLK